MRRLARAGVRGLCRAASAAQPPPSALPLVARPCLGGPPPSFLAQRALPPRVRLLSTSAGAADERGEADAADGGAAASELDVGGAAEEEPPAAAGGERQVISGHGVAEVRNHIIRKMTQHIKAGEHAKARAAFEEWRSGKRETRGTPVPFAPNTTVFNLYLAAAVSTTEGDGLPLLATTLEELARHGLQPTAWTFNPLAWLAFKRNSWPLAEAVMEEARKREITPTNTAYCFVLAVAASNFRMRRGDALLAEMKAHGMLSGAHAHGARVRASLNQLFLAAVRGRTLDVAGRALSALHEHGVHPTAATYGELLAAAAEVHDCDLAMRALDGLAARGSAPAYLDEGSLVTALGAAARMRHAPLAAAAWAALQAAAERRGVPLSAAAHAARLAALAAAGDVAGACCALPALEKAHAEGELPPGALAPLVAACSGGPAQLDDAYFTVERLVQEGGHGVRPSALDAVIAACGRVGDLTRAVETFDAIEPLFGQPPGTASYNALLAASLRCGRPGVALRVEGEMKAKGVPPDATTLSLLLDAALAAHKQPAALARLDDALAAGSVPSRETLRRLFSQVKQSGDEAARAKVLSVIWGTTGAGEQRPEVE